MSSLESRDKNRRFHARYDIEGVSGSFLFSADAKVVNLSLTGMAIETTTYLKVGHEYLLKLSEEQHDLPLSGRIIWCTLVRTVRDQTGEIVPVYRAGIHFGEMLSDKAQELYGFIEKHAIISLGNRIFGRFKLDETNVANLDYEAKYVVKQISLSGMLIETDIMPEVDHVFDMETRFGDVSVDIRGRVTNVNRIGEREGRTIAHVGIAFDSIDEAGLRTLETLIQDLVE